MLTCIKTFNTVAICICIGALFFGGMLPFVILTTIIAAIDAPFHGHRQFAYARIGARKNRRPF